MTSPAPLAHSLVRATLSLALGATVVACSSSGSTSSDQDTGADTSAADTSADTSPDTATACFELSDGRCVRETFKNPPVLQPNDEGVYELELVPTEFMVEGKRHCGRGYNGLYPAPTLETPAMADGVPRAVRVDIRNRFTKADYRSLSHGSCTCKDAAGESCEPSGHGAGHGCTCTDDEGAACHLFDFNTTNLHAHGSHVRPDYATGGGCVARDGLTCRSCSSDRDAEPKECYHADDVISHVGPGEGVQHRWDLDEDGEHHEGLFWYHPHVHGSTAIQVASGATGAWIVRGAVDELPGIKEARERVFVMMTPPVGYPALADGEPCDEDHITFNDFSVLGDTSEKQVNLINGIRRPRLVMAPGQVERWRFLHGAFLDEVTLALFRGKDSECANLDLEAGPVPLTQIARDGLTMPRPADGADWPFAPDYFFMSPGYRIESMLDGSSLKDGDTLCLMSGRFLQTDESGTTSEAVGLQVAPTADEILQRITNGDLVAIVNVTAAAGEPTETQLPDFAAVASHAPSLKLKGGTVDALERCAEVQAISAVDDIDQLAFFWAIPLNQEGYDPCACPDHNVNCENFELTDREAYPYDRVLTKGAVEHWRLKAGFDGHPFHIHINPFLVCPLPPEGADDPNTKSRLFEPPFAHWRDTYLINLDRTADVLTEYRTHTGAFVFHCHKLNHEDHGMMELIEICDPAVDDCDARCSGGPCTWRDCAPGDVSCERAVAATECLVDLSSCPEALLRCSQCGPDDACPTEAYCSAEPDVDGLNRCVPGCLSDEDCGPQDACDQATATCEPAPCVPPCGPGSTCIHGQCGT